MTLQTSHPIHILIADDDPDDCLLLTEALRECSVNNQVHFVHDGEQLMDYLHHRPPYDDAQKYPLPGFLLLDLNMPRKDGREALAEIKSDDRLHSIPVIVLSTSSSREDILESYESGANAYLTKPTSFSGLRDVAQTLGRYWLELAELPVVHQNR
jgi:two-component system, response regulator